MKNEKLNGKWDEKNAKRDLLLREVLLEAESLERTGAESTASVPVAPATYDDAEVYCTYALPAAVLGYTA